MKYPPCFNSEEEFKLWSDLYRSTEYLIELEEVNYCDDCTKEYKEKMEKENRCTQKEVVFYRNIDGIRAKGFDYFKLKNI